MIRTVSTAAGLAAVFAAGLSFANAAEPANCRMVNAKGEAGHAGKATHNANENRPRNSVAVSPGPPSTANRRATR